MDEVNEGDNFNVILAWKDADGAAVTPQSAVYRIDDVNSGSQIRGETSLNSTSTETINITGADTVILDQSNRHEGRRLTATAVYGTDGAGQPKQKTVEYEFQVNNTRFKS